jgi:hypothetical protein
MKIVGTVVVRHANSVLAMVGRATKHSLGVLSSDIVRIYRPLKPSSTVVLFESWHDTFRRVRITTCSVRAGRRRGRVVPVEMTR